VTTGLDVGVLRTGAVLTPVLLTAVLWLLTPDPRRRGAAVLAALWNLVGLLAVNAVAVAAGAWHFGTAGAMWAQVPVDVVAGWALLWGAVPILLTPWLRPALCAGLLVAFDALVMGVLDPLVTLAPRWWIGELATVGLCLIPGVLLGVLTDRGTGLRLRAAGQVALFGATAGFLLPAIAFAGTGRSWSQLWAQFGGPADLVAAQLGLIVLVIALAAVAEFVRGGGTPYPWDPPVRLVRSGPYAYLANPMQLCAVTLLLIGAAVFAAPELAAIAGAGAVFGAGLAGWSERGDLVRRFGADWTAYRGTVTDWLPRWTPSRLRQPARLYVAGGCDPCSRLGCWLAARAPVALQIVDADAVRPALHRLRYTGADGLSVDGTRALGAALEHLSLGWAVTGWLLRAPLLGGLVQLVADAVGAGPRVPR
jgi:protein-S-isoprenylcysteine O-methyltransferase Ste14